MRVITTKCLIKRLKFNSVIKKLSATTNAFHRTVCYKNRVQTQMRTKHFILTLCVIVSLSLVFIIFGQHKPETIQNIVSSTNEQIKNFKDTLRDAETKTFVADEKYLNILGFSGNPRLYPQDIWRNTSLPVVVTYVLNAQESQAIGLINNVAKILPNNTILVYNLGLSEYGLKTLLNYCNNSHCQVTVLDLYDYPSHVEDQNLHAFRPLVIQDALRRTGAVLFLECSYRFRKDITHPMVAELYDSRIKDTHILAWPLKTKNPVSSLTHKKMFEYFHTDPENYLFLQMVKADVLMVLNTEDIHHEIMLPWIQCSLTQDCIIPIGAQSAGCRFDKRPLYRYSGCHSYDVSALNIVLGLKFKFDSKAYAYQEGIAYFEEVPQRRADEMLRELEQNSTTDGSTQYITES